MSKLVALLDHKEALEGVGDIGIGGRSINTIKYADDLVFLTKKKETLQDKLERRMETGKKYGMKINI